MSEELAAVFAVAAMIGIVMLFIFCAVKPHLGLASVFYFFRGIVLIPAFVYLYQDGQIETVHLIVACVMDMAFFLGGIITSIKYFNVRGTAAEAEANKKLQRQSIRGGLRRLPKNLRP